MTVSRPSLPRSTSIFPFIGFAALMAIVAMNYWLGERAQTSLEDAISARDTRIAAVELRNAMQTAEASERGFLLTGNEIYLAPYHAATIQARRHMAALRTLLPQNSEDDTSLARLESLTTAKFNELDRMIALKRDNRSDDALAIFRPNSGKALTDEANVFFAEVIGQADDKLTTGVADALRVPSQSDWYRTTPTSNF